MTTLYHVTDAATLEAVLSAGLEAGSYLTDSEGLADWYAEGVEEEGGRAAVVEVDLDALIAAVGEDALEPDRPSVAEPITVAIGMSEDDVAEAWEACGGSWRDSLEIVRSMRVSAAVPAGLLTVARGPSAAAR